MPPATSTCRTSATTWCWSIRLAPDARGASAGRPVPGPEATKEITMALQPKRTGARALRMIVGLVLLGCARVGSAAGTWSVISLPQKPGEVITPTALAADAAGNVYVADNGN